MECYSAQILHHLKALTLPGSTRFQHRLQPFAHFCSLTDTGSTLASSSSSALSFDRQTSYLAQGHKNKPYGKKIGTSCGSICWSTPNAPHTKIILKPRTNRKGNTLWCYSLHELQIFMPIALRDNQRQHKTIAVHCLAPFTHPVCM
jgi:hypothetical protein